MATPTNLSELAAARLAAWQAEKSAAQTTVQTVQTTLIADQQALQTAVDADQAGRAAQTATDIVTLVAAQYTATGNASDKVAALERALEDADAALFDFVSRAASRLFTGKS